MNKRKVNCICGLVSLIVGLGILSADPEPLKNRESPHDIKKITMREDVTLDLRIPYSKILYGEIPLIYLGIKNEGDKPLNIDADFRFNSDNQLVYEARGADSEDNLTRPEFIPTWERLVKAVAQNHSGFENLKKRDYRIFATYGKRLFPLSLSYDVLPKGTQKLRVSMLTGENEWVFSQWVPLERLNERKLHECETIETIFKGSIYEHTIKQAVIDGERYLFLANPINGTRIARVPDRATPRVETLKKVVGGMTERTLIIHFDGVDVPPVIHDLHNIATLEGSAETTPHLEVLKSLEKAMFERMSSQKQPVKLNQSTNPNQKPPNKSLPTPTANTAQQATSPFWLWVSCILMFFLVLAIAWVKSKRR